MLYSMLLDIGFKQVPNAPRVFCCKLDSLSFSDILEYVDDRLILLYTVSEQYSIVRQLQEIFEVRVSDDVFLLFKV